MKHIIGAVIASFIFTCASHSAFATSRQYSQLGEPILVSVTGVDTVGAFTAPVLKFFPGYTLHMKLGATQYGELVLEMSGTMFPMPIPTQQITRFTTALKKGGSWCEQVSKQGVSGEKEIDTWSWEGFPIRIHADKPAKQSVNLWMKSVDNGTFCSIGIKASAGLGQGSIGYIPHRQISVVLDRITGVGGASVDRKQEAEKAKSVLDGLK